MEALERGGAAARTVRLGLILIVYVLLLAACEDGDGQDSISPTPTAGGMTGPTPTAAGTGLTEYDFWSRLLVKGRDRLRACVESLDDSTGAEDAATAIEDALLVATGDPRWHEDFGTPGVDVGCPLPPVALDASTALFADRRICRPEVSPYFVYVFVADASRFTERFPEELVRVAFVPGVRKATQESISVDEATCYRDVAEAWYVTPEDLQHPALLEAYIFSIFTIADIGR